MNIKVLNYVNSKIIVTKADIKKIVNTNNAYAYLVLQRLKNKKILKQIIKGKYTNKSNPYEIATNINPPAYISLLTASELKGYTEQIINNIQTITNKNKTFLFENYKFTLIKSKFLFGFEKVDNYFIADDEKLLIDCFLFRKNSGNFNEIFNIANHSKINKDKIITYLKKINDQNLIKRIGFMLEKIKHIDISKEFKLDKNYIFLDTITKQYKNINTKWRIKYDFD
ncbi:MAG: hypothetical protein PHU51_01390 [Candidatus Nanoarchaeia archaeon]|nr:hypothetical protein [Candidatus Nanoarchaeia archaeon]